MSVSPSLGLRLLPLLVLTGLGGALACGGGDGTGPPDPSVVVAAVEVSPSPASVLKGQTLQLVAVTKDADGTPVSGRQVTWATSNDGVATVSPSGVATGIATGIATITATSEAIDGTTELTVTAANGIVRTWRGGTSGSADDWSTATNWTPAGTPTALDTVRVAEAANPAVLSEDVVVAKLIVAGGVVRTAGHRLLVRTAQS
jgi:hypothetical protein